MHAQCEELPLRFLSDVEVGEYLAARFPGQRLPAELGHDHPPQHRGKPALRRQRRRLLAEPARARRNRRAGGTWRRRSRTSRRGARQPAADDREAVGAARRRRTAGCSRWRASPAANSPPRPWPRARGARRARRGRVRRTGAARAVPAWRAATDRLADGTVAGRYAFLHALYQQVLYERVARGAARAAASPHRRMGGALVQRSSEGSRRAARDALRARTGSCAGDRVSHAGGGQRHAPAGTARSGRPPRPQPDAAAHLPDGPDRAQHELALLVTLGVPLLMTKGYASQDVERTYARARELCAAVGESPQLPAGARRAVPLPLRPRRVRDRAGHRRADPPPGRAHERSADLPRRAQPAGGAAPLPWRARQRAPASGEGHRAL